MAIERTKYQKITNFIIDNLEGGYYHPDMLKDGRIKDQRYSSSGETMFGIDRLAGGSLNTTPAGQRFWSIIDNANARRNWKWNYKGGNLENKLKEAAADVMYGQYDKLASRYLTPESRKLVEADDRLLFNFIYATWNGSGWFKRFAQHFNDVVASGVRDKDALVNAVVSRRTESTNSLIAQGGRKIAAIIDQFKNVATETAEKTYGFAKRNWMPIALFFVGVVGLVYFGFFYKGKVMNKKIQLT